MVLYHYEAEQAGEQIERAGWRIAHCGEHFSLQTLPPKNLPQVEMAQVRRLPGAVGW